MAEEANIGTEGLLECASASKNEVACEVDAVVNALCSVQGALELVWEALQGDTSASAHRCRDVVYLTTGEIERCTETLEDAFDL